MFFRVSAPHLIPNARIGIRPRAGARRSGQGEETYLSKVTVWEQRWHPLREEWVLFTSHRAGRPWVGETKPPERDTPPSYDPSCYLCPGNERIHGRNPNYEGVYTFTNDLPTFSAQAPQVCNGDDFYRARPALGTAEVICYHPGHDKTFADLSVDESLGVVEAWTERYRQLGARPEVNHVLIFENKGSLVGTSNPHPHCQLYAGNMIYGITERELAKARGWAEYTVLFMSCN